jgi:hypothetical protein
MCRWSRSYRPDAPSTHRKRGSRRHERRAARWCLPSGHRSPGAGQDTGPTQSSGGRFVMNRSCETRVRRDQRRYTPAVHSRPVFTDPSGRRRRAMRRIGLVSAVALAICLGAVVVAMAGGPAAPFTDWAAPRAPVAAPHKGGTTRAPARGTTSLPPSSPRPGPALSPSPSAGSAPPPSGSAKPRPTASDTAVGGTSSPVRTNPAGRTPPGHTKSPRPGSSHGL